MIGRNALITGSTSGMGLEMAKGLVRSGCNVILNGFGDSEAAIKEVEAVARLVSKDVRVDYHDADMRKSDEIEDLVAAAERRFGGTLDIVVNNAGIQHVSKVENFPVQKWKDIMDINLNSSFHTTRLVMPGMRKKNWGRIINIASVHGLVASAEKSAYVAAKHGLVGFTKSVALETATTGITVNAICPGWVLTPLVEKQIKDKAAASGESFKDAKSRLLLEKQPSGEFVKSEALSGLVTFLCSEAAAEVRGVAWNMDGGWNAQ
jgi:3-hydroxybutyrate dehydrogenase